ncbi:MAG: PorP/SprF family type IX secretion system membrane protein [Bacteroidales bacterium]|nr:PorP/SprF family type IX secretion system membrane protein [Bacteroidales bacterium]MCF8402905.1 PorP/SprF family type IX secretion system membrane protein [Bacteroidales bacterium]
MRQFIARVGIFFPILFISLLTLNGQDVHYSQMYATPLYINPAFTGNHDCEQRAGVNYRQQAASFTIPFTTYTAWGDTRIMPDFLKQRGWFGLGAHMYYDNAGDGDLKKVQAMLMAAYSQGFNADNSLYGTLGVGIGYTNRSINTGNLIFGDMWDNDNKIWDLDITSADIGLISNSSIFYLDFNIGGLVHHYVNEDWMYEVGGSISHINQPTESFFGEADSNNKLRMKYISHLSVQRILSDYFMIKPEVYFVMHEGTEELILGANLVYSAKELNLHGGLWHRLGRDIIPVVGIEYNKLTFLFSYDVNISDQRKASLYQGGFELSIVKRFCYRRSTKKRPCKYLEF